MTNDVLRELASKPDSCDICRTHLGPFKRDHCHYHGQWRGNLCHRCNLLMGKVDTAIPVLVEWVNAEDIAAYRARCTECANVPLSEIIEKYESNRKAGFNAILTHKPVSTLPKPYERMRLRSSSGITQQILADTLGVSRKTVHAWEHGKSEPTGINREQYAEILALWAERESETKETQ